MIKYIGSKRALLPWILDVVRALPDVRTAVDLFSGTARVGHALKAEGLTVQANDHNTYAATLARGLIEADDTLVEPARALLEDLQTTEPVDHWFTEQYGRASRYLQPHNAAIVAGMRESIAARDLSPTLEAVALTALMLAADRVDSTTGVQMAYLKAWSARSHKPVQLRLPPLLPGAGCRAHQLDALGAARHLTGDLIYLDPPYNQHKYLGNYHLWETLVRWDNPEVYGKARKRVDCKARKSPFNSRPGILPALRELIETVDCRHLVVSFSDEGFVSRDELMSLLARRGPVVVLERSHERYVGAKIGIYGPSGAKVGTVGRLRNREFLFVQSEHATRVAV